MIDTNNAVRSKKKPCPHLTIESFVYGVTIQSTNDSVFIPNWHNRPMDLPPLLTLKGESILSYQNITSIIASPGMGKSSICEATLASFLNPDADCLGIRVSDQCSGLIYIDFERTNLDVWNSFYRMCKRAGISQGVEFEGVQIAGMRAIPRLKERISAIENLLDSFPCSLLVLDGAGDLVTDTNDLLQAIECRIFLRELTVKYKLSILTTLHPNPNSFKPRGHIGSEILRESETVLLAKKGEGDTRIITSDFEHGKNRNNATVTTGYKWCDVESMFVSIDVDVTGGMKDYKAEAKKSEAQRLAMEILSPLESLSSSELVKAICQQLTVSEATAKRRKSDMVAWDIIEKDPTGNYRIK